MRSRRRYSGSSRRCIAGEGCWVPWRSIIGNRIQDEGMLYEHRKHTGETPIVGVNTFTDEIQPLHPADDFDLDVTRSDEKEKMKVITRNAEFRETHSKEAEEGLSKLKNTAREGAAYSRL